MAFASDKNSLSVWHYPSAMPMHARSKLFMLSERERLRYFRDAANSKMTLINKNRDASYRITLVECIFGI